MWIICFLFIAMHYSWLVVFWCGFRPDSVGSIHLCAEIGVLIFPPVVEKLVPGYGGAPSSVVIGENTDLRVRILRQSISLKMILHIIIVSLKN